jgi:transaldolase
MKFFLDTANIDEIRNAAEYGLIDGPISAEVGMDLVADLVQIFENFEFETQILVASCRTPLHIREAALLGAHVATMPYKLLEQLLKHPLTDIGLERFLKDWEKVGRQHENEVAAEALCRVPALSCLAISCGFGLQPGHFPAFHLGSGRRSWTSRKS